MVSPWYLSFFRILDPKGPHTAKSVYGTWLVSSKDFTAANCSAEGSLLLGGRCPFPNKTSHLPYIVTMSASEITSTSVSSTWERTCDSLIFRDVVDAWEWSTPIFRRQIRTKKRALPCSAKVGALLAVGLPSPSNAVTICHVLIRVPVSKSASETTPMTAGSVFGSKPKAENKDPNTEVRSACVPPTAVGSPFSVDTLPHNAFNDNVEKTTEDIEYGDIQVGCVLQIQ